MNRQTRRELGRILQKQLEHFRKKFGRDPLPNEPIFFDPEAATPLTYSQDAIETIKRDITAAMAIAGIEPAKIYAYHKTGRIVTEENAELLTAAEISEWNAAIEEYDQLSKETNLKI